jgi:hypothetical protein
MDRWRIVGAVEGWGRRRERWRRFCTPGLVACLVAVAAMAAAPAEVGAAESIDDTSCVIAGTAGGSFPAWNFATPIDRFAAAPDGSVVFVAREAIWRYSAGAVTWVAGGGGTRPAIVTGPVSVADLRIAAVTGLDVGPDGTIWVTDGKLLYRIAGGVATPLWDPPTQADLIGIARDRRLADVQVTAAGVYLAASIDEVGKSYHRVVRWQDGVVTEVAGGGFTMPWDVGDQAAANQVQLWDSKFSVDDAGRVAISDITGRRLLVTDLQGTFRSTTRIASLNYITSFGLTAAGVPIAADGTGTFRYDTPTWTRRPGPAQSKIELAYDGSTLDLTSMEGVLRRTTAGGATTELTGWSSAQPRFTNAGRTASTAYFGKITAIEHDGADLLVAEEVPTENGRPTSRIVRVRPNGAIQAVAGNGVELEDGPVVIPSGPAGSAPVGQVREIDVVDGRVLFAADMFGVGRVDPDGTLRQLSPTPFAGYGLFLGGIEQLADGRILFSINLGELFFLHLDGRSERWKSGGQVGSTEQRIVPIDSWRVSNTGDIETDASGRLLIQSSTELWRVDLAAGVATREWPGSWSSVLALDQIGSSGIGLDPVGNVYLGGYYEPYWPHNDRSDLWRLGPDGRSSMLGRIFDEYPEVDQGDPELMGMVADVSIDDQGRPVLADGLSGRIRRLGPCEPAPVWGVRPLTPARLLDTRDGTGRSAPGRPGAGATVEVQVSGRGGVPVGARAVTLNVTAVDPTAASFLTVWPCGREPTVSNINFGVGSVVANQVNVALSPTGTVCLRSPAATHVVADVQAWFGAGGSGVRPTRPARLLDSRAGGARVAAGATTVVAVRGRGGVPASDVSAASLNVTVTDPQRDGWLTVYPCGQPRPLASNLNFTRGATVPNAVLSGVGADGSVCIVSSADTHVVVDVMGSWGSSGDQVGFVSPERSVDTRAAWGAGAPVRLRAGQARVLRPTGSLGVPSGSGVMMVNATAVDASAAGFVTLYPCDGPLPLASVLNVVPREARANSSTVPLASDGALCALSSTDVDLILDVAGFAP